jgi:hypothetical protein
MGQAKARGGRSDRVAQAVERVNAANGQTTTLLLLDRNVVSVIKDAVADKEQKGEKEQRMLEFLREIDTSQHAVSPLPSLIEGEHGREDSSSEKTAQLEKETDAVARFFQFARTDSAYLNGVKDTFAEVFSGFLEGNSNARATFREKATPLVIQAVAVDRRRGIEDQLVGIAVSVGLERTDGIVVLFIACLYGNRHSRDVLKLSKPEKWFNVLNDLYLIPRIGLVKSVARALPIPLKVRLLTLDGGLEQVLRNVRIVEGNVTSDGEVRMQLRYLPPLFTDLSEGDAIEVLNRLNSPNGYGRACDSAHD